MTNQEKINFVKEFYSNIFSELYQILKPKTIAELLGISYDYVRRLLLKERIPSLILVQKIIKLLKTLNKCPNQQFPVILHSGKEKILIYINPNDIST